MSVLDLPLARSFKPVESRILIGLVCFLQSSSQAYSRSAMVAPQTVSQSMWSGSGGQGTLQWWMLCSWLVLRQMLSPCSGLAEWVVMQVVHIQLLFASPNSTPCMIRTSRAELCLCCTDFDTIGATWRQLQMLQYGARDRGRNWAMVRRLAGLQLCQYYEYRDYKEFKIVFHSLNLSDTPLILNIYSRSLTYDFNKLLNPTIFSSAVLNLVTQMYFFKINEI